MAGKPHYTAETLKEIGKKLYGDKYDFTNSIFIPGKRSKFGGICSEHGPFQRRTNEFIAGKGCPKCSIANQDRSGPRVRKDSMTTEQFIAKAKERHGDRYDYSKVNYRVYDEHVTIGCPKHGDFNQLPYVHTRKSGCPHCFEETRNHEKRDTREDFIKKSEDIYGENHFDYSKVVYVNQKTPVLLKCLHHNHEYAMEPYRHLRGHGCAYCHRSAAENAIGDVLRELGVSFIPEFKFEGYSFEYDFYLPEYALFIEYHGVQHFYLSAARNDVERFAEARKRDAYKIDLAKRNGAKIVVFDYKSFENRTLGSLVRTLISDSKKVNNYPYFYTLYLERQEKLRQTALGGDGGNSSSQI